MFEGTGDKSSKFSVHYGRVARERRCAFLDTGEAPAPGWRLRQPELAATLETLAREGHDGFYRGALAETLVAGVRAGGGIWSLDDLTGYRVVERPPVRLRVGELEVTAAALPSSGGIVLAQILNTLAGYRLAALPEADRTHLLVEAMRRKGLPVTYINYPDEGHGFARPENRLSFYAASESFLAQCLGGTTQPIGDDLDGSSIEVLHGAEFTPGLAQALAR